MPRSQSNKIPYLLVESPNGLNLCSYLFPCLWGLTIATKLLFLPFIAIGTLFPAALLFLRKRHREGILLSSPLVGALAVFQSITFLETWLQGGGQGAPEASLQFVATAFVPVFHARAAASERCCWLRCRLWLARCWSCAARLWFRPTALWQYQRAEIEQLAAIMARVLKEDGELRAALDLHIHDTDFVQFLFGRPRSVFSTGVVRHGNAIDHVVTQYNFPDGPAVYAEGSWLLTGNFNMSYTVICERATLDFDLGPELEKIGLKATASATVS
jgi:hypothetical protein